MKFENIYKKNHILKSYFGTLEWIFLFSIPEVSNSRHISFEIKTITFKLRYIND